MTLTREQRDKWAEELESGRWKQCRSHLRSGYGYCCLGVLCVAVLNKQLAPKRGGCEAVHDNPEYPYEALTQQQIYRFTDLNDRDKLTFSEIAKHVRALPVSDGDLP
jgi:hypothetical protein